MAITEVSEHSLSGGFPLMERQEASSLSSGIPPTICSGSGRRKLPRMDWEIQHLGICLEVSPKSHAKA